MKLGAYHLENLDYFRNNEFPARDSHQAVGEGLPQTHSNVEAKPVEDDRNQQEKEQQLEAWMSDIKAFIRNIDISRL